MNSKFHDNLKPTRSGFTLVELLFVVAILAILGTLAAGILGKAKRDAQIAATRSRITQIEAIMLTVLEDQEVRRIPGNLAPFVASFDPREQRFRTMQLNRRLRAALLLAEFPAARIDVSGDFVFNPEAGLLAPAGAPVDPDLGDNFLGWAQSHPSSSTLVPFLEQTLTAEMAYWQNLVAPSTAGVGTGTPELRLNLPGEYLYNILSRVDIDGISALETLGPNAVGDSDDDGYPDIVDAFGDSMQLRIVQVAVNDATSRPDDDIWSDTSTEINWQRRDKLILANGADGLSGTSDDVVVNMPRGYEFLNPVIPRSINKIRFQVVSPSLEETE